MLSCAGAIKAQNKQKIQISHALRRFIIVGRFTVRSVSDWLCWTRQSVMGKSEELWISHLNVTVWLQKVYLTARIYWRALQESCRNHLMPGSRPMTSPLVIERDELFKLRHFFIDL